MGIVLAAEDHKAARIIDIMAALKASLKETGVDRKKPAAKRKSTSGKTRVKKSSK